MGQICFSGAAMCILLFAVIACKQPEPDQPVLILASDLAFKAELSDSASDIDNVRQLHQLAEEERTEVSDDQSYLLCCCPCPPKDEKVESESAIAAVMRQCPCPTLFELKIVADEGVIDSLRIGNHEFLKEESPRDNKVIYRLEQKIPDGETVLMMKADFLGTGSQNYRLDVVIRNSKLFLKR